MPPTTNASPITLSACLIVRDEEQRLPACLASVAFCDEIIVVDSGSRDRTVEIARAAGATVLEHPWEGFAIQRNVALDAAHGEWALEVDADERISPRLRDEILELVRNPPSGVDNAIIPLRQLFLGTPLGPSALYPAGRVRLFRRDAYRHDATRTVHEGLWPSGASAYLTGDLEHILAESLGESLRDLRNYTRLESEQLPDGTSLARALGLGMVLRPTAKFAYRMVILGGWRDGTPGALKILLDCLYDANTWLRYVREGRCARRRGVAATESDGATGSDATGSHGGGHFGRAIGYRGPVRIAAVARGERRTAAAESWLERAAGEGADVVLITDARPADPRVRTSAISGRGPLAALRAVAYEEHWNTVEAIVVPSNVGRRTAGLLPGHLRGVIEPSTLDTDPRTVIDAVRAHRARR